MLENVPCSQNAPIPSVHDPPSYPTAQAVTPSQPSYATPVQGTVVMGQPVANQQGPSIVFVPVYMNSHYPLQEADNFGVGVLLGLVFSCFGYFCSCFFTTQGFSNGVSVGFSFWLVLLSPFFFIGKANILSIGMGLVLLISGMALCVWAIRRQTALRKQIDEAREQPQVTMGGPLPIPIGGDATLF